MAITHWHRDKNGKGRLREMTPPYDGPGYHDVYTAWCKAWDKRRARAVRPMPPMSLMNRLWHWRAPIARARINEWRVSHGLRPQPDVWIRQPDEGERQRICSDWTYAIRVVYIDLYAKDWRATLGRILKEEGDSIVAISGLPDLRALGTIASVRHSASMR